MVKLSPQQQQTMDTIQEMLKNGLYDFNPEQEALLNHLYVMDHPGQTPAVPILPDIEDENDEQERLFEGVDEDGQ
jgi:hypothetical protein